MKFYVASKWQDRRKVRRLYRTLIARGHEITVDWTNHVNPGNDSLLQEWAGRDIEGVTLCDCYIGIFTANFWYTGALVEMGAALALGKRVWIIGNAIDSCIFMNHPLVTKFSSIRTMLKTLEIKPRK